MDYDPIKQKEETIKRLEAEIRAQNEELANIIHDVIEAKTKAQATIEEFNKYLVLAQETFMNFLEEKKVIERKGAQVVVRRRRRG